MKRFFSILNKPEIKHLPEIQQHFKFIKYLEDGSSTRTISLPNPELFKNSYFCGMATNLTHTYSRVYSYFEKEKPN